LREVKAGNDLSAGSSEVIQKRLGRSGETIPAIGLGTWQLRGNEAESALRAGISAGAKFIDTAEIYGTEELVGRAIRPLINNGEKVFVATKVWPTHFRYDDVLKACDRSLSKLGVRTIDLYQLHWPNPALPISNTMKAMERLVDEGKVRYIGVSNFSVKQLDEARSCLSKYDVVSDQVEYSPFNREADIELLHYLEKEDITLIAYSPLGHGKLFKRFGSLMQDVAEIGKKYDKTPAQVLLNWLISSPQVIAIPKASSVRHAVEDAGAGSFVLGQDDLTKISSILSNFGREKNMSRKLLRSALSIYVRFASYL